MTSHTANFESAVHRADAVLDRIATCLSAAALETLIDEPIDLALTVGTYEPREWTAAELIETVARRLSPIRARDVPLTGQLMTGRDDALSVIDEAYGGRAAFGFEQALLEVNDTDAGGLAGVLVRVADHLKTKARQQYQDWVFTSCLDRWDHECIREIAGRLRQQCKDSLAQPLEPRRAAAWAHLIPQLWTRISTDNAFWSVALRQTYSASETSWDPPPQRLRGSTSGLIHATPEQ